VGEEANMAKLAAPELLTKRMAIDKANGQMVIVVAVAAFITVFCLIASHSVWKQDHYQSRVNSVQGKANNQLKANIAAFSSLKSSYNKFVNKSTNIIGGQSNVNGSNNGSNAQIVLDALPPNYDFPALTSSIGGLVTEQGLSITSISGTDEQLDEENNSSSTSPQPVAMPFTFTIDSINYNAASQLVAAMQNSIRPIQIDTLELTGSSASMTLNVTAHTFFQPGKTVNITEKTVQ
jgi:hypothetical protein